MIQWNYVSNIWTCHSRLVAEVWLLSQCISSCICIWITQKEMGVYFLSYSCVPVVLIKDIVLPLQHNRLPVYHIIDSLPNVKFWFMSKCRDPENTAGSVTQAWGKRFHYFIIHLSIQQRMNGWTWKHLSCTPVTFTDSQVATPSWRAAVPHDLKNYWWMDAHVNISYVPTANRINVLSQIWKKFNKYT